MPTSRTPGSSTSLSSSAGTSTLAFTKSPTARHSQCSRNPLHAGGSNLEACTVRAFATACQVARRPVRIWPVAQPSAPFTSRLPTGRSPFPLLGMTTASTGVLCWWDFHPLEWQLASLQGLRSMRRSERPGAGTAARPARFWPYLNDARRVALAQALRSLRIAGRFARVGLCESGGSPCCLSRRQGDTMRREFTMSGVTCVLLLLPHF